MYITDRFLALFTCLCYCITIMSFAMKQTAPSRMFSVTFTQKILMHIRTTHLFFDPTVFVWAGFLQSYMHTCARLTSGPRDLCIQFIIKRVNQNDPGCRSPSSQRFQGHGQCESENKIMCTCTRTRVMTHGSKVLCKVF